MIGKVSELARLIALSGCVLLALLGSPSIADQHTVTLSGEIEVAGYDDQGTVESVAVYDGEWGSVLVAKQGKGNELLRHVGAVVRVTGEIVELDDDSGYLYSIEVNSYTIEQPAELDEFSEWDPEA